MEPSRIHNDVSEPGTRRQLRHGTAADDFELFEADDQFVLNVEMPGFDSGDITLNWDEGRLFVSAESEASGRGRQRSFRRTFRMPKAIAPDEIDAQYRNGILEIRLPILDPRVRGKEIEVKPG